MCSFKWFVVWKETWSKRYGYCQNSFTVLISVCWRMCFYQLLTVFLFSFPGLPCRHRCASSFLPSSSTASWCVDWRWSSIREGDWFLHSRSFKQCRKTWKVRYFFIINFFSFLNFCRLTFPLISTNQLKSFVILAVLRRSVLRVYGAHLWFIALEQHSSFRRNITPEASCWQHCIWFYRPEIWTYRSRDERVSAQPIGGA